MAFDVSSIGEPVDVRYPSDLAVSAIDGLQGALPSWVPRNASLEVLLIEAVCLATAEVVNAGNQTVGAVVEQMLANFHQVPRRPGSPAVGEVTITFDSAVSTTIPAGMGFVLVDYGVEVSTTSATAVSAASSVVVQVASVEATTLINGVGPGAALDVLDVVPNVLSVAVTGGFSGGADPESDAAYTARARSRLARVTNSLVVPDAFAHAVLEDGRASNAVAIRSWDGTGAAPTGLAGTHGGHVTVVTYGRGAQLSSGVRAELAAAMQAISATGTTIHVNPVQTTSVAVTCTVKAADGFDAGQVQAAVEAAVRGYLSPESWPFGDDVVTGALSAVISDLVEVDYVDLLAAPSTAVSIPADGAPLAGAVAVSVI